MCGIGGGIGISSKRYANKIIEKLHHRGPDSNDYWTSQSNEYPATLCHTRLSVLDLSKLGSQPFYSEDGRYVFIFNGEIYNYIELKSELEKKGCIFHTKTDTEVFFNGLIEEGISFQLKCNGMWAFAIWDRKLKKLTLGRDRFGVKPLYYSLIDKNKFFFGSEMKVITPFLKSISPSKNINLLIKNLFNYESTQECVIEGINRLQSGHVLEFHNGITKIIKYWNTLDYIFPTKLSYPEQLEKWKYLFLDSTNIRLRSDVSIGCLLSGGLDSSSIVSAASHISKNKKYKIYNSNWQNLFHSSFPNHKNDESKWAEIVANQFNLKLNKIDQYKINGKYTLEDSIAMVEDPYITIPLPMLMTYKEVKSNGISVTLDGHGADELLGGYGNQVIKYAIMSTLQLPIIKELFAIEKSLFSGIYSNKEKFVKRRWIKLKMKNILRRMFNKTYAYLSKYSGSILPNQRLCPINFCENTINHEAFLEMDAFNQILFEMFHFNALPTLLRNYDRYSMANGVESRMPYMDWRLVCFSFSLPWQSKIGGGYTKRILRESMKNLLNNSVRLRRDKIGWNAPTDSWLRNEFKEEIYFLISKNKDSEYFDNSMKIWKNFQDARNVNYKKGEETWSKLLPSLWEASLQNELWK